MEDYKDTYWAQRLWEELRARQPDSVCKCAGAVYDPSGFYELSSMDGRVRVFPADERLEPDGPGICAALCSSIDYQLLAVSYLVHSQNIEPTGEWVSEKELTGGSIFYRGPHAMPSAPIEKRFGSDPAGFREKSLLLGASQLEFGDVSMAFPILPRISFAVVLWVKDDEFPARVTFMFDSSISAHLEPYVILAMTQAVTELLLSDG